MDTSTVFLLIVVFILIIIFSLLKTTCPRREQPTSIVQTTTGPTQPGVRYTTPPTAQGTTPPSVQRTTPPGQGKTNLFSVFIERQTDNNRYMDEMIKLDNSKLALYHMPPSFEYFIMMSDVLIKSINKQGDKIYATKTEYLKYIELVINTLSTYANGLSSITSTPQPQNQEKLNLFESITFYIDRDAYNVENDNAVLNKNKIPKSYIDFLEQHKTVYDVFLQNQDQFYNSFYVTKEDYLNFIHKVIDTLSNYSNKLKSLA